MLQENYYSMRIDFGIKPFKKRYRKVGLLELVTLSSQYNDTLVEWERQIVL